MDAPPAQEPIIRSWRPAPARAPVTARLDSRGVTLSDETGATIWSVAFADLASVRYVRHGLGAQAMVRLELTTRTGDLHRLEINQPAGAPGTPLDDFMAFVLATLGALARYDPDLPYSQGERASVRMTLFLLGLAVAAVAAAAGGAVVADGVVLPGLGLAVAGLIAGGFVAWGNAPWRDGQPRRVGDLLERAPAA